MTEATFTSGPWTAKWSRFFPDSFIVQAGMPSNRVLARFDGDGDGPDAQSIADAHLIAAAPDLLDALKRLEMTARILPVSMDEDGSAFSQARAAIAKATGAAS